VKLKKIMPTKYKAAGKYRLWGGQIMHFCLKILLCWP